VSALDDDRQAALRAELEAAEREIRRSLRSLDEAAQVVELDQPTMGRLSRMDAMQTQSMAKANRAAARQRLQQIEAALQRMDDDEYGHCGSCDEPIGWSRLKVRPEAVLCIGCQERQERRR
jgi:DnaK suppressor protein